MLVTVFHKTSYGIAGSVVQAVAEVEVPDETEINSALEFAYRRTNNIEGSWSVKEKFLHNEGEIFENGDFNESVNVLVDLPEYGGRQIGLRSTSMFDEMEINGERFQVKMFGFEPVDTIKVRNSNDELD